MNNKKIKLYIIFSLTILIHNISIFAKDKIDNETLIELITRSPSISSRCKNLFKKRSVIKHKLQRINKLTQSNDLLLRAKVISENHKITKKLSHIRLQLYHNKIYQEVMLSNIEEKIIREGCPGLLF